MRWLTLLFVPLVACSNAAEPGQPDAAPVRIDGGPPDRRFGGLVINEVAAAGDPDDWFELFNGAATALELGGVTYSDEPASNPAKATFPEGTIIAAGGYLLTTVSDAASGFKLGGDEALGIFAPDRTLIDLVDWDDGQSPAGASYGRIPDGRGAFMTLATPTPGAANIAYTRTCGNGAIEGTEVCDADQLAGRTCASEGFASGPLACSGDCTAVDTSGCVPLPVDVVLNEVSSAGDDPIELLNRGPDPIDLAGWFVHDADYVATDPTTEGHRFVLAAGSTLAPGGRRVLVKGRDHGFGLGAVDALVLRRPDATLADETAWSMGDADPSWCRLPDGQGAFARCLASFGAANVARPVERCGDDVTSGAELCDGADLGGRTCVDEGFVAGVLRCATGCDAFDTRACVAASPQVVINEASSDGDDLIELFNAGTGPADLAGWSVIDSDVTNTPYVFPAGSTLAAGAYRVLTKGTEHSFGLGGTDGVTLRDGAGATVDGTAWTAGAASPSWCRRPDGSGAFATCAAASFGAANGP